MRACRAVGGDVPRWFAGWLERAFFSAYEAPLPNAHRLYVMTTNPGEQYRRGSDGLLFRGRPAPYSISKLPSPTDTPFDQSACTSPVMCGQGAKVAPAPLYCPHRMDGSGFGKPGERRGNLGRLLAFVHGIYDGLVIAGVHRGGLKRRLHLSTHHFFPAPRYPGFCSTTPPTLHSPSCCSPKSPAPSGSSPRVCPPMVPSRAT